MTSLCGSLSPNFLLQLHNKKNIHLTLVCPGPVKTAVDRNSMVGGGKTFGKSDNVIQQGMSAERYVNTIFL